MAGCGSSKGTDANTAGSVPGFAVYDELEALVESGLTPYQALRTATAHAAELLGAVDEFGTLAVGRRADLLLLEANPLDDVGHVARRVGVVAKGRWFTEAKLQAGLADLAAAIPTRPRRWRPLSGSFGRLPSPTGKTPCRPRRRAGRTYDSRSSRRRSRTE